MFVHDYTHFQAAQGPLTCATIDGAPPKGGTMGTSGWLVSSLCVLGIAACGDGGGAADGNKLGALSADERSALCDEYGGMLRANAEALAEVSCTLAASSAGDRCEAERKTCLDQASADGGASSVNVDEATQGCETGVSTSCPDITVAEARACFDALVASVRALAAAVTCNGAPPPKPSAPAACQALSDRCPELATIGGA